MSACRVMCAHLYTNCWHRTANVNHTYSIGSVYNELYIDIDIYIYIYIYLVCKARAQLDAPFAEIYGFVRYGGCCK